MNFHQHFYVLSHNPTAGIMTFVNDVLTVICQLESLNHKPQTDEVTNKLFISLHSSFVAVDTNLLLCTPEPFIKAITATLKEFEGNKTLHLSFLAPNDSAVKDESALYANGKYHHGRGWSKPKCDNFDWGHSKGQKGVCFHCGHSQWRKMCHQHAQRWKRVHSQSSCPHCK